MTQAPPRNSEAFATVGYPPGPDSKQWQVPVEIYRSGGAKAWIEQQLQNDALAQEFNTIRRVAEAAATDALRKWEESSDTAIIRRLIGTDARSLAHLAEALKDIKVQAKEIGGTTLYDAALIARRLIERIRLAQDFENGFGEQPSFEPVTPIEPG